MSIFQELDIEVDRDDYRPAVLNILAAIRPQWKKEEICITDLERGQLNVLVKCSANAAAEEDDRREKVIIRVFGDVLPFHRDSEVHLMRLLSEKGIIPPVYCRFKNGVAYQYAPGTRLTREQLKDENILRQIAVKMHSIHQLDDIADQLKQSGRTPFLTIIKQTYDKITLPDINDDQQQYLRYNECLPSKAQLDKYMEEWNAICDDLATRYPIVFGHYDVQDSNIIIDTKTDNMVFVDWECCDLCPEILDVAVLIARDIFFTGVFTDSASMKQWLKIYLSTHPVYGKQPLTADILDTWYRDCVQACIVIVFALLVHFITCISNPYRPLDYIGMATQVYNRYMGYRKELEMLVAQ